MCQCRNPRGMSKVCSTDTASVRNQSGSLHILIHQYFFYGWLFADASVGSDLERVTALQQNRNSAKWLPTYIWRWSVFPRANNTASGRSTKQAYAYTCPQPTITRLTSRSSSDPSPVIRQTCLLGVAPGGIPLLA